LVYRLELGFNEWHQLPCKMVQEESRLSADAMEHSSDGRQGR
jgi:hypothetical protein